MTVDPGLSSSESTLFAAFNDISKLLLFNLLSYLNSNWSENVHMTSLFVMLNEDSNNLFELYYIVKENFFLI